MGSLSPCWCRGARRYHKGRKPFSSAAPERSSLGVFADLVAATLDATGALAFTEVTARFVIDMGCALTPAVTAARAARLVGWIQGVTPLRAGAPASASLASGSRKGDTRAAASASSEAVSRDDLTIVEPTRSPLRERWSA